MESNQDTQTVVCEIEVYPNELSRIYIDIDHLDRNQFPKFLYFDIAKFDPRAGMTLNKFYHNLFL